MEIDTEDDKYEMSDKEKIECLENFIGMLQKENTDLKSRIQHQNNRIKTLYRNIKESKCSNSCIE